jgi:hypothetical protein
VSLGICRAGYLGFDSRAILNPSLSLKAQPVEAAFDYAVSKPFTRIR